jgi:hypothetical protein
MTLKRYSKHRHPKKYLSKTMLVLRDVSFVKKSALFLEGKEAV